MAMTHDTRYIQNDTAWPLIVDTLSSGWPTERVYSL